MKLGKIQPNLSFKRELTNTELQNYTQVLSEAKSKIAQGGKSIFIVHEPCLPESKKTDTGVGHLSSNTSSVFFDFIKNYMGINTVEVLPPGEISRKRNGFYNTYNGSALSLGTQGINLELLTTQKFNHILPVSEFAKVVRANTATQKTGFANYENIIGKSSPQEKALRIAFNNFMKNKSIDKTDYKKYKEKNNDVLERKAIYKILKAKNNDKSWEYWTNKTEKNLFTDNSRKKLELIKKIKTENAKDIEFYKFKQFIADEHLKIGRKNLNAKGMKLFGDCLIGFSEDEVWAYRDAFKKDSDGEIVKVGQPEWKLPALDYDTITEPGSASQELLKKKVKFFAKRYDGIRFDCSWAYVNPKLSDESKYDFNGTILDIIEDTVKEVKGKDYDPNNLIHEFEAGKKDFSIFEDGKIKPFLKGRVKVITSSHLGDKYGSTAAMEKQEASPDSYVIGVGNHDPLPLRKLANGEPDIINGKLSLRKEGQIIALRNIFGVSYNDFQTPVDFVKYKFAEPLSAKNNMIFYMDAFGREERFDAQDNNDWSNYRYRIPENYPSQYHSAVQSGYGFNPMDGYAKVFMQKDLDTTEEDLFYDIVKFAKILEEKPAESE